MSELKVSVPQIIVEEEMRNATNPFKKTLYWMKLRCKLCNEIVLGKGICNQKEWDKIRRHLEFRHGIEEDEGIPIRLLSSHLRAKWFRLQFKKRNELHSDERQKKMRERNRRRYQKNPRRGDRTPEQKRAHGYVERYPELKADACELCPEGDVKTTWLQAHHPDYDYPQIIVTCCPPCHKFAEEIP